jgi:cytochrome c oxidase subunit 3
MTKNDSLSLEHLKEQRKKASKPLLWVSQASIFMAFAGLTSGYIVSRGSLIEKGLWVEFSLPSAFFTSTVLIIVSSVLLIVAQLLLAKGKQNITALLSLGALILGIMFGLMQIEAWKQLIEAGIYFTGEGSTTAGSWIYTLSFFHLLHIIAGVLVLLKITIKSFLGKYTLDNRVPYELGTTFWHFLGFVWIFLYVFLLFYR